MAINEITTLKRATIVRPKTYSTVVIPVDKKLIRFLYQTSYKKSTQTLVLNLSKITHRIMAPIKNEARENAKPCAYDVKNPHKIKPKIGKSNMSTTLSS